MSKDYTGLPCKICSRPSAYKHTNFCKICYKAYRKELREHKKQKRCRRYISRDKLVAGDSIFVRIREGIKSKDIFGNEMAGTRFTRGKQVIAYVTNYVIITIAGYNLRREWFHIERI